MKHYVVWLMTTDEDHKFMMLDVFANSESEAKSYALNSDENADGDLTCALVHLYIDHQFIRTHWNDKSKVDSLKGSIISTCRSCSSYYRHKLGPFNQINASNFEDIEKYANDQWLKYDSDWCNYVLDLWKWLLDKFWFYERSSSIVAFSGATPYKYILEYVSRIITK